MCALWHWLEKNIHSYIFWTSGMAYERKLAVIIVEKNSCAPINRQKGLNGQRLKQRLRAGYNYREERLDVGRWYQGTNLRNWKALRKHAGAPSLLLYLHSVCLLCRCCTSSSVSGIPQELWSCHLLSRAWHSLKQWLNLLTP